MTMAVHSNIPTAIEDAAPVPGERRTRPFQRFAALSSAGGIVLLLCTVIAMVWANSGAWESYHEIFHILEGRAEFTVGDETIIAEAGSLVIGPANVHPPKRTPPKPRRRPSPRYPRRPRNPTWPT